jgi:hypothetical protein
MPVEGYIMTTAESISLVITVLIICITIYSLRSRKYEREEFGEKLAKGEQEAIAQRAHERHMLANGYMQVPVLKEHHQEAFNDKDNYGDGEDRVTNQRQWQLAWVPKDQAEMILMASGVDNEDAGDLIQEALRST